MRLGTHENEANPYAGSQWLDNNASALRPQE